MTTTAFPRPKRPSSHRWTIVALLLAVLIVAAGCGDDDDAVLVDDTTGAPTTDAAANEAEGNGSTSEAAADPDAVSQTEMSPEELEVWQTDLNAVGCWAGPVDGANGPQTEAAIRSFQAAKGLTVDGLLGPVTEGVLQEAVAAGETVCTTTTEESVDPPDDAGGALDGAAAATLTSDSYDQTFTLGSCSVNADLLNISLRAEVNGLTLVVDGTDGEGSLAVDGGTEGDGITLNGAVESIRIADDDSFSVTGTFGEPNNSGESFTLSGSC